MLAAFVLHLLANTGQDQQADFEQILLQARILQGEESTYELSKVVWSPDGKWGGYTIREKRLKTGRYLHDRDQMVSLCVVSRDRKTVKRLDTGHPFGGTSEDPTGCYHTLPRVIGWSPDGRRLHYYKDYPMGTAAVAGSSLHDADPRSGKIRELTKPYENGEFTYHTIGWSDAISFSPNGKELMLLFGQHKYSPNLHQIVVVNYDTLARRWITRDNKFSYDPEWSPDGSQIAYSAQAAILTQEEKDSFERTGHVMWSSVNRLWIVSFDGSRKRQLTDDTEWTDDSPRWIDEETIRFIRSKPSISIPTEHWEIKADGTDLKRIKVLTYDEQQAWRDENDNSNLSYGVPRKTR